MSQEPLFWYRPRSDGGYEGPLHNGQIEDVRKASGSWVPLFAGAAPVSVEPIVTLNGAQLLQALDFIAPDRDTDPTQLEGDVSILYGAGHAGSGYYCYLADYPDEGAIMLDAETADDLISSDSDPALTQQTLDDVKAGIPARDAEIAALRKEIEALQVAQAQQPVSGADGTIPRHVAATLANAIYETAQKIGIANRDHINLSVGQCLHLLDCMAGQLPGNPGELDELAAFEHELLKRIPNARLNRTHDGYLNESYEFAWRMWQARAALAQQDADKVDAERYRYLKARGSPSYNIYSQPEICLRIESQENARVEWMKAVESRAGLDAAIDAARKEQA